MGGNLYQNRFCSIGQNKAENSKNINESFISEYSLLENISDAAPLGFLLIENCTDDILYYNRKFCEIWNIELQDKRTNPKKASEIITYLISQSKHKDIFEPDEDAVLLHGLKVNIEEEISLKDGRTIMYLQKKVDIGNRCGEGCLLIFGDISPLRTIDERLYHLTRNASDAITVTDSQGNMAYNSPAAAAIFGYNFYNWHGQCIYHYVHQDDLTKLKVHMRNVAMDISNEDKTLELKIKHANGTWRNIEARFSNHLQNPAIKGIIINSHDVTNHVELERRTQHALEKEKELNDLKSQFISMVSHEYRTPLTSILSSIELLEMFGNTMNDNDRQSLFTNVRKSVDYLTDLMNDVLLVNRGESGKLEFCPAEINIFNLIKEVIRESAYDNSGRIKITPDSCDKIISADSKLIRHIISNLINNALKYSPSESTVEVKVELTKGCLLMEITDKGIGIPEKDQAKLFDPFFRGSNACRMPGSGLGLSIVKKCVDMHRGEITFESRLNEGSTFRIMLPAEIQ